MSRWFGPNLVLASVVALSIAGCQNPLKRGRETGEGSGTVTLNGQPLTSGVVFLVDEVDNDTILTTVGSNGKFMLKYKGGPKIPCGNYKVAVGPAQTESPTPQQLMENPGKPRSQLKSPIPEKYRDAKTSGLTAVIKKGANTLKFDLQGE